MDLVETSCAERPVLLVAEDLHWADSASLLAISSVARQLPLSALLVVVTARPSPLPAEVGPAARRSGGRRARAPCSSEPLTSDDVAALAGQVLGARSWSRPDRHAGQGRREPAVGRGHAALAGRRGNAAPRRGHRRGDDLGAARPRSSDLVVRRLRHLPTATLELLQVTAVLGDAVSLRDVAAVARRPPAEVVGQLGDAFDAQLLDEADDRVVFRHQLVHDAIYQHMPPPARRLLHREAAVALMAAGADRLDVADHLMLGAERGDEQAVAWLRDAAREASAQAPLGRRRAPAPRRGAAARRVIATRTWCRRRSSRRCCAPGRWPRRRPARKRCSPGSTHAEVDTPLRLALVGALALQNRADELIAVAQASLAGPTRLRPSDQVPMLAQQSWALTYSATLEQASRPPAGRSPSPSRRATRR